jgi:hypothetical protein
VAPETEVWIPARLRRLDELLRAHDYRGWDPFDLPNSPLLARVPATSWLPQLVLSKAGSRLMPDLGRRLLRVPRIEDPKIYACAYFGYRYGDVAGFRERTEEIVDRLARLARPQSSGARAWGYDYVWATRASGVNPRGASTIVPGSFAVLTLLHHAADTGDERHLPLVEEALGHYATRHAAANASGPFIGYFEGVTANTHNANLLGCAALTLAAGRLDRPDWLGPAAAAAATTMRAVREDGYLEYADQPSGDWTDCFHHLYSIACARAVADHNPQCDRALFDAAIERMWRYAREQFLRPDGLVNYFPGRLHPVDPHNYAAAALFALLMDERAGLPHDFAHATLNRVDGIMWDPEARRYEYKKHPRRTDRRLFLRWTQAWMFAALGILSAGDRFELRSTMSVSGHSPTVSDA